MSSDAEGKKPKKSLFNKPKWGAPKAITSDTDLFSRSNRSYESFKLDEAERKRKKAERKSQEKKNRESRESQAEGSPRKEKRRRVSSSKDEGQEKGKDVLEKADLKDKPEACDEKTIAPPESDNPPQSPQSLSKRYEAACAQTKDDSSKPKSTTIIELDDDESNVVTPAQQEEIEVTTAQAEKSEPSKAQGEEEDPIPSDEEFPDLVRKAREKARRKRLEAEKPDISTPDQSQSHSFGASGLSPYVGDASQTRSSKSAEPAPEPIINLLVTSSIPNTTPLVIRRKLTQRFKEVRLAWCNRQGFDDTFAMGVFLTWRGMRVFDVNSCKALGIGVDADDNVVLDGEEDAHGERDRRIHMEAMTQEMFDEYKLAKRRAAEKQLADRDEIEDEEPPPVEKPKNDVRIIIRAKSLPDQKLLVSRVSDY